MAAGLSTNRSVTPAIERRGEDFHHRGANIPTPSPATNLWPQVVSMTSRHGVLLDPDLVVESLNVAESVAPGTIDQSTRQPHARASRLNVLVVDDEPLMRWSIAQTLLGHDIVVMTAEEGRTAINETRLD